MRKNRLNLILNWFGEQLASFKTSGRFPVRDFTRARTEHAHKSSRHSVNSSPATRRRQDYLQKSSSRRVYRCEPFSIFTQFFVQMSAKPELFMSKKADDKELLQEVIHEESCQFPFGSTRGAVWTKIADNSAKTWSCESYTEICS